MQGIYHSGIIRRAREIWELSPIFLDTETTGLGNNAEIVEICIINQEGDRLFDQLIHPRLQIPPDAVLLHGITNSMVEGARNWFESWLEISSILDGQYIGIYNSEFDLRMMQQSHRLNGMEWKSPNCYAFDIMKMYANFAGFSKWQRLEQAARQCGIIPPKTHRAYHDAVLARDIFFFMLQS